MRVWKFYLKRFSGWLEKLAGDGEPHTSEEIAEGTMLQSSTVLQNVAGEPQEWQGEEEKQEEKQEEGADLLSKNQNLVSQNQELRSKLEEARAAIEQLSEPPNTYGTVINVNKPSGNEKRWTADIYSGARKLRVGINPELLASKSSGKGKNRLKPGQEVLLNAETMNIIGIEGEETSGEIVTLKEVLEDRTRAVVVGRGDEEKVLSISDKLHSEHLKPGDSLLANTRSNLLLERLPKPEIEELILEETPNISYENVAGLDQQIEMIIDAVELPFLHQKLFQEHQLPAPKGILLYGPPGCGKTLIAKAVANSLASKLKKVRGKKANSSFFNIKGPELLNKYVGETERQIRLIFQRAREKSLQGGPVIVFFDEMESLFRTRGSGISSDVESTIVPQLLAEIDGLEALRNVIVIGASNREDLIDPAILRPGRLDVKIKIERPDAEAAQSIFACYLTENLPIAEKEIQGAGGGDKDKALQNMIEQTVQVMYATDEQNRFLEVTYISGDKEIMYFKDFTSGAMIENIVRRAKKLAVKRYLAESETSETKSVKDANRGLCLDDLQKAVSQEFKEHEDLPNTTNPDDWAKISGKKGQRITFVRTLLQDDKNDESFGGRSIEQLGTGQYL